MSKERELLMRWLSGEANEMTTHIPLLIETQNLLAQPERDKVDFQTLNELGLRRLQVSDTLVLQESCSKSPAVIFAENGKLLEIIKYKKLLEIRSFIDEVLNYADTPKIGVDDEC